MVLVVVIFTAQRGQLGNKVALDKPVMGSADRLRAQAPMTRGRANNARWRVEILLLSQQSNHEDRKLLFQYLLYHLYCLTPLLFQQAGLFRRCYFGVLVRWLDYSGATTISRD